MNIPMLQQTLDRIYYRAESLLVSPSYEMNYGEKTIHYFADVMVRTITAALPKALDYTRKPRWWDRNNKLRAEQLNETFLFTGACCGVVYAHVVYQTIGKNPSGDSYKATIKGLHEKNITLAQAKNHDYASGGVDNITLPGIYSITTRLLDKTSRIYSLSLPGVERQVRDESLLDTLSDGINYSAFGIMLLNGVWEK